MRVPGPSETCVKNGHASNLVQMIKQPFSTLLTRLMLNNFGIVQ